MVRKKIVSGGLLFRRCRTMSMLTSFAAGHYLHWGVLSVSLTNLLIMAGMVLVFVLALVLPFPRSHDDSGGGGS
jgi:hypothetical protein